MSVGASERAKRRHGAALALCFGLTAAFAWCVPSEPTKAQLFSPGELSRSHARLDGDSHCNECHESGRGVSTTKCLVCHADLGARIRAHAGLHGREYQGQPCSRCHVEHLGRNAAQVRWPGGRPERLDHRLTGWPLHGEHARVECNDCHDKRNSRGARTYLGLRTACASCHQDPHGGRFGNECQSCHRDEGWQRVDFGRFDHSTSRFPLRGAHAQVECARCHGQPARYRGLEFQTCASCHQDPHRGSFGGNCADCHQESSWGDLTGFNRRHPGLSLAGGHARVSCTACHDRGRAQAPSRGRRCVGCHEDVHEAPFGNDCRRCHENIRWLGVTRSVALEAHRRAPFQLTGEHGDVACERCHDPRKSANARYRQLEFQQCKGCHQDPHPGDLVARGGGDCASCHTAHGFWPTTFDVEAHARTRFPLEGRHRSVPCTPCHGEQRPRLDLRVEARTCESCHTNPHGDRFATQMQNGGCASCHGPHAWGSPRIEHDAWPLTGAHAQATCSQCHRGRHAPGQPRGAREYRGAPRECEGCHSDPHAGQFRLEDPRRGCDDCHETRSFAIERFDHAQLASYPLEGAHARARCDACHRPEELANGDHVVRFRLGYRGCADCHANPHAGERSR